MKPTPMQRALFEAGLRQLDVTLRTGVSPGDVSLIARGLKMPSPALASKIAAIVGVPVDKLWPPISKQAITSMEEVNGTA